MIFIFQLQIMSWNLKAIKVDSHLLFPKILFFPFNNEVSVPEKLGESFIPKTKGIFVQLYEFFDFSTGKLSIFFES